MGWEQLRKQMQEWIEQPDGSLEKLWGQYPTLESKRQFLETVEPLMTDDSPHLAFIEQGLLLPHEGAELRYQSNLDKWDYHPGDANSRGYFTRKPD